MISGFVETKTSKLKRSGESSFQNVVFREAKNEKPSTKNVTPVVIKPETTKKQLDMKKVRYDIIKFGSRGLKDEEKEKSRIAFAVSLGAKPPKNKYTNYKQMLAAKKLEKEKSEKQKKYTQKFASGYQKSQSAAKGHKKGLLDEYGTVTKTRNQRYK